MNAKKRTVSDDRLPGRVYPKDGAFYWFPKEKVEDRPSWIFLCRIEEGETKMLARLSEEMAHADAIKAGKGKGNIPTHVDDYIKIKAPQIADSSRDEWERQGGLFKKAFRDWNVEDADAAAISDFLTDNWTGKLHSQRTMRAWISGFFGWCIVPRRLVKSNPCKELKLKKPKKRKVYIPDDHFLMIRDALMIGDDGKKTPTGPMMQCFVDLCYLCLQRSTEIRYLRKPNIGDGRIHFEPTKTEDSSGEVVDLEITPEIQAVLDRAAKLEPISEYIIRDKEGKPKTDAAVRDCWNDAKRRAGLADKRYTVKDILAKAMTDAEKQGYTKEQLRIARAHTSVETTEIYLKDKQIPVSQVRIALPAAKK
jgi:integrase